MTSVEVTPNELRAIASKVDDEATNYYNAYKALYATVDEIVATDFQGEDANAFKTKIEGFEDDFNKMKELMNQYAEFLRQSAKNYEDAQERAKNAVNGLQN